MFVWQCIKQEGVQLGPCVDRFLVGTCCRLPPEEDNLVPGASGDQDPPNKVKPTTSSTTTTSTTTTTTTFLPTSTDAMTTPSAPLTNGTSRPGIIEAVGSTHRPIVSPVIGQSANEPDPIGQDDGNATTTANMPSEDEFVGKTVFLSSIL